MYNSLLLELLDWAKSLKEQYNEAEDNRTLACLMDSCADFLDTFIERAEEI